MKKPLLFPLLKNKPLWLIQVFICFLLFFGISSKMNAQIINATCNTKSPWVNGTAFNNLAATGGTSGACIPLVTGVSNTANAVDANLTNVVQIDLSGIGCTGSLKVVDGDAADIYPSGTFAGFKVSSANLLSGSIASTITIKTYNNGSVVETYNAVTSLLGVNASLVNGDGSTTLGFITTQPFDGVEIIYSSLLGLLNSFQVYHPVIEKFCAGTALACNEQTPLNNPNYPTFIDANNTGITGICVGCSIDDAENVISANTADFASIVLLAGVAGTGSIGVKDQITTYASGTFAGFNISNASLINANLLSGISIETYLNGVFQEVSTTGTLASVNSSLTGSGAQTVGFVTSLPFNEVKLKISNLIGILNTTNVYNAVFQKFCAGPSLTCSANTNLINPAYPVIIDGTKSGIGGVACVACSVNNSQNVIDSNLSNSASIVLTAGLLANGSIAVKDQLTTYPSGTFAGFDIDNVSLIGVNLLGGVTVTTYLNGVQKETSGGNLISLELLTSSRQVVGFTTTQAFDEVKITVGNFASINLGTTIVYGAVLRGASAAGTVAPIITATTLTNTCPTATVSLAGLANTGTKPVGTSLIWSTHKVPTSISDTLSNLTTVATAGKYYAMYFDKVGGCYSQADSVTISLTVCVAPLAITQPTPQTATTNQAKSGNATTDLAPTGGTSPYIYSNGSTDPLCVAPVGATALPLSSNLVVNTNGSFTYTAPAIAGTYYFCVKVCDSTTPTAVCTIATYQVVVSAPACGVGSAIPVLK